MLVALRLVLAATASSAGTRIAAFGQSGDPAKGTAVRLSRELTVLRPLPVIRTLKTDQPSMTGFQVEETG
jgi:hypothetical protein